MKAGGIFTAFDVSASALRAERARMNVHANNLANINTTRDKDGNLEPYRRQFVRFREGAPEITGSERWGVSVAAVESDYETDFILRYDPGHPDANEQGYVAYPNVQVAVEMVDMMMSQRAYEANLTAIETAKQMHRGALQIIA